MAEVQMDGVSRPKSVWVGFWLKGKTLVRGDIPARGYFIGQEHFRRAISGRLHETIHLAAVA